MASGIIELDDKVIVGGVVLKKRQFRVDTVAAAPATATPARKLRVFISHASEDKGPARLIREILRFRDMEPWLDEEDIDPGWEWEAAIEDAIAKTDVVLFCCSPRSVNKEGYFLEEVSKALKLSDERPDSIFLVPVRLEDCNVLIELGRLQWADLHKTGGIDKLTTSLTRRAKRLGLAG